METIATIATLEMVERDEFSYLPVEMLMTWKARERDNVGGKMIHSRPVKPPLRESSFGGVEPFRCVTGGPFLVLLARGP